MWAPARRPTAWWNKTAARLPGSTAFWICNGCASGLSGVTIGTDVDTVYGAVSFKQGSDGCFRYPKTEVAYKYILHGLLILSYRGQLVGRQKRNARWVCQESASATATV